MLKINKIFSYKTVILTWLLICILSTNSLVLGQESSTPSVPAPLITSDAVFEDMYEEIIREAKDPQNDKNLYSSTDPDIDKIKERVKTAYDFYKANSTDNDARIKSQLMGIDFREDVSVKPLNQGEQLDQMQARGFGMGEIRQGSYYAYKSDNATAEQRGIAGQTVAASTIPVEVPPPTPNDIDKLINDPSTSDKDKLALQSLKQKIEKHPEYTRKLLRAATDVDFTAYESQLLDKQTTDFKVTGTGVNALVSKAAPTMDTWSQYGKSIPVKGGGTQVYVGNKPEVADKIKSLHQLGVEKSIEEIKGLVDNDFNKLSDKSRNTLYKEIYILQEKAKFLKTQVWGQDAYAKNYQILNSLIEEIAKKKVVNDKGERVFIDNSPVGSNILDIFSLAYQAKAIVDNTLKPASIGNTSRRSSAIAAIITDLEDSGVKKDFQKRAALPTADTSYEPSRSTRDMQSIMKYLLDQVVNADSDVYTLPTPLKIDNDTIKTFGFIPDVKVGDRIYMVDDRPICFDCALRSPTFNPNDLTFKGRGYSDEQIKKISSNILKFGVPGDGGGTLTDTNMGDVKRLRNIYLATKEGQPYIDSLKSEIERCKNDITTQCFYTWNASDSDDSTLSRPLGEQKWREKIPQELDANGKPKWESYYDFSDIEKELNKAKEAMSMSDAEKKEAEEEYKLMRALYTEDVDKFQTAMKAMLDYHEEKVKKKILMADDPVVLDDLAKELLAIDVQKRFTPEQVIAKRLYGSDAFVAMNALARAAGGGFSIGAVSKWNEEDLSQKLVTLLSSYAIDNDMYLDKDLNLETTLLRSDGGGGDKFMLSKSEQAGTNSELLIRHGVTSFAMRDVATAFVQEGSTVTIVRGRCTPMTIISPFPGEKECTKPTSLGYEIQGEKTGTDIDTLDENGQPKKISNLTVIYANDDPNYKFGSNLKPFESKLPNLLPNGPPVVGDSGNDTYYPMIDKNGVKYQVKRYSEAGKLIHEISLDGKILEKTTYGLDSNSQPNFKEATREFVSTDTGLETKVELNNVDNMVSGGVKITGNTDLAAAVTLLKQQISLAKPVDDYAPTFRDAIRRVISVQRNEKRKAASLAITSLPATEQPGAIYADAFKSPTSSVVIASDYKVDADIPDDVSSLKSDATKVMQQLFDDMSAQITASGKINMNPTKITNTNSQNFSDILDDNGLPPRVGDLVYTLSDGSRVNVNAILRSKSFDSSQIDMPAGVDRVKMAQYLATNGTSGDYTTSDGAVISTLNTGLDNENIGDIAKIKSNLHVLISGQEYIGAMQSLLDNCRNTTNCKLDFTSEFTKESYDIDGNVIETKTNISTSGRNITPTELQSIIDSAKILLANNSDVVKKRRNITAINRKYNDLKSLYTTDAKKITNEIKDHLNDELMDIDEKIRALSPRSPTRNNSAGASQITVEDNSSDSPEITKLKRRKTEIDKILGMPTEQIIATRLYTGESQHHINDLLQGTTGKQAYQNWTAAQMNQNLFATLATVGIFKEVDPIPTNTFKIDDDPDIKNVARDKALVNEANVMRGFTSTVSDITEEQLGSNKIITRLANVKGIPVEGISMNGQKNEVLLLPNQAVTMNTIKKDASTSTHNGITLIEANSADKYRPGLNYTVQDNATQWKVPPIDGSPTGDNSNRIYKYKYPDGSEITKSVAIDGITKTITETDASGKILRKQIVTLVDGQNWSTIENPKVQSTVASVLLENGDYNDAKTAYKASGEVDSIAVKIRPQGTEISDTGYDSLVVNGVTKKQLFKSVIDVTQPVASITRRLLEPADTPATTVVDRSDGGGASTSTTLSNGSQDGSAPTTGRRTPRPDEAQSAQREYEEDMEEQPAGVVKACKIN